MKFLKSGIVLGFLVNSLSVFGQWNIQTGYDFGIFKVDYYSNNVLNKSESSQHIHRLKGKLEYRIKGSFLISLNTGVDIYDIYHNLDYTRTNPASGILINETSIHHSRIQTYRTGFSVGYQLHLKNHHSLLLSLTYDHFFINKVNIKRSDHIKKWFLNSEEYNQNNEYLNKKEHTRMINLTEIGYKNNLIKDNRHIIFSLGYRYQNGAFFVSPSIGVTTKNRNKVRPFAIPKRQNLFLFGINFGYTLPQKSKKSEK